MEVRTYEKLGIQSGELYTLNVARGIYPGKLPVSSFGERVSMGAESGVLWPDGAYAIPPAAGIQMQFQSTNTEDSATGTGIKSLHVHCVLDTLEEYEFDITLNGLTPVLTPISNIRFIECIHINTGAAAVGTISATAVSPGTQIYSQITPGKVRCSSSVRMVPKNKRAMIYGAVAGCASGTAAASGIIRFCTTEISTHQYTDPLIFIPHQSLVFQDGSFGMNFPIPFPVNEGQLFGLTYEVDKSARLVGSIFGILEEIF